AANINPFVSGFYCTWVNIKNCVEKDRTAFTRHTGKNEIMPIPIAHGEGRFTTKEEGLLEKLKEGGQIVFRYCDRGGNIVGEFPVNPNGSVYNIAAICNPEGNVMSIMPHPERASWNRQVPGFEGKSFRDMDADGPGRKIFHSMKEYIEKEGSSWK
ncbi:MAG: phosphoribosylformylglycinamidine synthase subunit PurQ, partial [Candidatus Aenigmatarchaeota archaeon]